MGPVLQKMDRHWMITGYSEACPVAASEPELALCIPAMQLTTLPKKSKSFSFDEGLELDSCSFRKDCISEDRRPYQNIFHSFAF